MKYTTFFIAILPLFLLQQVLPCSPSCSHTFNCLRLPQPGNTALCRYHGAIHYPTTTKNGTLLCVTISRGKFHSFHAQVQSSTIGRRCSPQQNAHSRTRVAFHSDHTPVAHGRRGKTDERMGRGTLGT